MGIFQGTMANQVIDRPLLKLAETFEQLASKVNSQSEDLELGFLIHGFSLMLPLLRSFGIVFKIVESDAVQKVFFFLLKFYLVHLLYIYIYLLKT